MKRFDALITTQKTSAICKVPFLNKARKTANNGHFLNDFFIYFCYLFFYFYFIFFFLRFFLIVSEMGLRRELRILALQSVHPNASFKLSNPLHSYIHLQYTFLFLPSFLYLPFYTWNLSSFFLNSLPASFPYFHKFLNPRSLCTVWTLWPLGPCIKCVLYDPPVPVQIVYYVSV